MAVKQVFHAAGIIAQVAADFVVSVEISAVVATAIQQWCGTFHSGSSANMPDTILSTCLLRAHP